jgi:hypothetical protein
MKFKTDTKLLVSILNQVASNGQLKIGSTKEDLVKSILISTMDKYLHILGRDVGATTYCRSRIAADIEEEGKIFIADLRSFINNIKSMHGKQITVTVDNGECKVEDGNEEFSFGLQTVTEYDDLEKWAAYNTFVNGSIVYNDEKNEYQYKHWFTIDEGNSLNELSEIAYKKCKVGFINIETVNGSIIVSAKNPSFKLSSKKSFPTSKTGEEKLYQLIHVFPALNNTSGVTSLYTAIISNDKLRLWIVSGATEWMVKCHERKGRKDEGNKESVPEAQTADSSSD